MHVELEVPMIAGPHKLQFFKDERITHVKTTMIHNVCGLTVTTSNSTCDLDRWIGHELSHPMVHRESQRVSS